MDEEIGRGPGPQDMARPDEDLLRRFLIGEAKACRLVEKWAHELVRFKFHLLPSFEHEEIVQDTISDLWRAVSKEGFRLRVSLRSFVRAIAAARSIDRLRKYRPTSELLDVHVDPQPGPYDRLLKKDETARLRWAIQNAGQSCQEVIRLHYYENRTFGEIAEQLGRAEATLRVRMFNCVKKIREMMRRWNE